MATAVDSPSPADSISLNKDSRSLISFSSEKRFWKTLRNRFDNQKPIERSSLPAKMRDEAKRMKQESKVLMRGFDSMAHSLAQFSYCLGNALQGARELRRPPTFTEVFEATIREDRIEDDRDNNNNNNKTNKRGTKRKQDCRASPSSTNNIEDEEEEEEKEDSCDINTPYDTGKLKKAKNVLAISITNNVATTTARELKSVISDLKFLQERCALLEEENIKLRDGLAKGIPPDEDDLVRLQLEALLAEKSRLANENTNLTRENERLHQIVEYHQQLTSRDFSAPCSNNLISRGTQLNFSGIAEIEDGCCNQL